MAKGGAVDLTRVQRAWLGHLRKAARGGETVRGYASRNGLSEHAMYQAAKVLRAKGALGARKPAAEGRRTVRPRFVELKIAEERAVDRAGAWRARLPNGVVIEGEGALAGALEALGRL